MTTDRTVMQQALGALQYHVEQTRPIDRTDAAIAALQSRLSAEPAAPAGQPRHRNAFVPADARIEVLAWPSLTGGRFAEKHYKATPQPAEPAAHSKSVMKRLAVQQEPAAAQQSVPMAHREQEVWSGTWQAGEALASSQATEQPGLSLLLAFTKAYRQDLQDRGVSESDMSADEMGLLNMADLAIAAVEAASQATEQPQASLLRDHIAAIPCRSHGDPAYDHDAYWFKAEALKVLDKAFAATEQPKDAAEAFVRDLLWNDQPECCGRPVVGAEYMGQQEMVCCGCPEPSSLNDAQIVASLRARFQETEPKGA